MSQENVEIVRRLYDAIARGDSETVLSIYHPDFEADYSASPQGKLTGGTLVYRGHDGVRRLARDWTEAWSEVEYDLGEMIDAGEHVVSALTYRGRGRGSGVEVERTDYPVWTIQDGMVIRAVWLDTREAALKAAGLSEK